MRANIVSKQTNYDGMTFRVIFVTEGGAILATTEWSTDREALIHLTDKINQSRHVGIRASIETKGTGYVAVPQNIPSIQRI